MPPEDEPPRQENVRVPGLGRPMPRASARIPDGMAGRGPVLPADRGSLHGEPIRGTLELSEGADPSRGVVLFVIARSTGAGPPLAVKRLAVGPFPVEFEIGPADAMLAGRPFAGPIRLSARLDADGDPLTRQAEDLVAEIPDVLEPGTDGVRLVLAQPGS